MNKPRLVAISGYAQSGKTTIASYLDDRYGYVRYRFADTLKNMLRTMGLTDNQIDGDEKEVPLDLLCGHTPRYAMQTLGTEWGRCSIGQEIWINAWSNSVKKYLQNDSDSMEWDRIVVDDVRFINELEKVKEVGGLIIRVERPNIVQIKNHKSETALDDVKWNEIGHVIINDGTKEELFIKVDKILQENGK